MPITPSQDNKKRPIQPTQRRGVAALMPTAVFRGANRYSPPPCFVSLPFGELMTAHCLLTLKEQKYT